MKFLVEDDGEEVQAVEVRKRQIGTSTLTVILVTLEGQPPVEPVNDSTATIVRLLGIGS